MNLLQKAALAALLLPSFANAQCGPFHQVSEDFSTTSGQVAPDCWYMEPSNNVFEFDNGYATFYGTDRVLILPNTTNQNGVLTFQGRHLDNKTYGGLNVLVGVYSGSTFTQLGAANYGTTGWINFSFDFASYSGSAGNIAIKTTSNSPNTKLAIDNVLYQTLCTTSDSAVAISINPTLNLDATGVLIMNASSVDGGSHKSCLAPITNLSVDKSFFSCDDLGENTIVLTADDDNGHTDTAIAVVNIQPTINLLPSAIVLDSAGSAIMTKEKAINVSTSTDCEQVTYAFDRDTFNCADAGTWHLLTVMAIYGDDTASFQRNRQIFDYIDPVVSAQDITVTVDENTGWAIVQPEQIDLGSSDECGIKTRALSDTAFSCNEVGVNQVTYTVTDSSNNQTTVTINVTVESFIPESQILVGNNDVCFEDQDSAAVWVEVFDSWTGADYYLRYNQDSSVAKGPIAGNDGVLVFQADSVAQNTSYHVYAEVPDLSQGLWLPGTNDYLEVQTPGGFDYSQGYTFSAWIKNVWSNGANDYEPIFYAGGATGSDIELYVTNTTSRLQVVHNRGNGGTMSSAIIGTLPTDGEYFHLAVTWADGASYVYINGVYDGAAEVAAPLKSGASELTFGYMESSTFPVAQYGFNGSFDDIRIYDVARSGAQIASDYDYCLEGDEDNLALYYPLNDAIGAIVFDAVANVPGQIKSGGGLAAGLTDDNAISCSFTCNRVMSEILYVGDYEAPEVVTRDTIINIRGHQTFDIDPSFVNDGSTDNCTNNEELELWLDTTSYTINDTGIHWVTLYAQDLSGNVDSGLAQVTIIDDIIVGVEPATTGLAAHVYPNPNNGAFKIVLNQSVAQVATIRSLEGAVLHQIQIPANQTVELDLDLIPSIYILELTDQVNVSQQRLVVY